MVVKDNVGCSLDCILCAAEAPPINHAISELAFLKSRSSNTTTLDLLFQVVGRANILNTDEIICSNCCEILNQIDFFTTSAKQLEHQLKIRFENNQRKSPRSSNTMSTMRNISNLPSGSSIDVSPSLSVTVMEGPLPKKRRYGIPAAEYLSSTNRNRRHCCDFICNHTDPPHKSTTQQPVTQPSAKENSTNKRQYMGHSIKCSVGDLDKSRIASILNTPTSSVPSIPDIPSSFISNSPEPLRLSSLANEIKPLSLAVKREDDIQVLNQMESDPVQVVCALPDTEDESSSSSSDSNSDSEEEAIQHIEQPNYSEHQIQDAAGVSDALLLNNPMASSLLQSFLATSLWFQGGAASTTANPHHIQYEDDNINDQDSDTTQQEHTNEDVTRESLTAHCVQDKNTRQELKNTGQSYVNTKGKMVDAKRVAHQDCSKCTLRCNAKISEVDRQSVFGEFWGLADYARQREYLAEHMHREEKLGPSGMTRTVVLYYLTHRTKVQVCRQFFLKTLDVSEKASRIVLEKKVRGEFGNIGAPPPAPTHRTTSSRSRRCVVNNQDSDYEY